MMYAHFAHPDQGEPHYASSLRIDDNGTLYIYNAEGNSECLSGERDPEIVLGLLEGLSNAATSLREQIEAVNAIRSRHQVGEAA